MTEKWQREWQNQYWERQVQKQYDEAIAEAIAQEEKQYQEFLELQIGTKYYDIPTDEEEE